MKPDIWKNVPRGPPIQTCDKSKSLTHQNKYSAQTALPHQSQNHATAHSKTTKEVKPERHNSASGPVNCKDFGTLSHSFEITRRNEIVVADERWLLTREYGSATSFLCFQQDNFMTVSKVHTCLVQSCRRNPLIVHERIQNSRTFHNVHGNNQKGVKATN